MSEPPSQMWATIPEVPTMMLCGPHSWLNANRQYGLLLPLSLVVLASLIPALMNEKPRFAVV